MTRRRVVASVGLAFSILQLSAQGQSPVSAWDPIRDAEARFWSSPHTTPTLKGVPIQPRDPALGASQPVPLQATPSTFSIATLPLVFTPNVGQEDTSVRFTARGHGYTLQLTASGAVLSLAKDKEQTGSLRLKVRNARPDVAIEGVDELPAKVNYLIGRDPAKWRRGIASYHQVAYRSILPGIDLIYHGQNGQLEYDFRVSPGANPRQLEMGLAGENWNPRVTSAGDLDLINENGSVRFARPIAYQLDARGARRPVKARYALSKDGRGFGFSLGPYDHGRQLVIDPSLLYSYYFGGSNSDSANALAVDPQGNVYIAGNTASTDLPTTSSGLQPATSAPIGGSGGNTTYTGFVAKFDSSGQLVFATYLGGSSTGTYADGIAVDAGGNIIVVGQTVSTDFPLQNPAQSTCGPAATINNFTCQYTAVASCAGGNGNGPQSDAFVTKLDPTGSQLVYSTYLGGSGNDWASAVTVDSSGEAYVVGGTMSVPENTYCALCPNTPPNQFGFPTTADAYLQFPEAYCSVGNGGPYPDHYSWISKLSPTGALDYSTYFGPTPAEIAVATNESSNSTDPYGLALDSASNLYVVGQTSDTAFALIPGTSLAGCHNCSNGNGNYDAWVAEFNFANTGSSQLVYSGLIGGSGSDYGYGIALDTQNNIYVAGQTQSSDFPTTPGSLQPQSGNSIRGFVTKLNQQTGLVYSALLGTNGNTGNTSANAIAVDASGTAVVTGSTQGLSFTLVNPLQATDPEGFLLRMTPDGSGTLFSTYFGGFETTPEAVALDSAGNAYIAGNSTNIQTTVGESCPNLNQCGSSSPDAFVAKINMNAPPPAATITSGPANPTNASTATFNFTDTQVGVTFLCNLDNAGFSACTSGVTYSSLSSTAHTFAVEAEDSFGSASPVTTYNWTINTTLPPAPMIVSGPANPTTATTATFSFSDTQAGVTFLCSLDSATPSACTSGISYSSLSVTGHTFAVEAEDSASNISQATAYSWTITSSSPVLQSIAVTPNPAAMTQGLTQQFTATGSYSDSSTQDLTTAVTWASSNTGVASITSGATGGLASGLIPGSTNITATLGSVVSPVTPLTVESTTQQQQLQPGGTTTVFPFGTHTYGVTYPTGVDPSGFDMIVTAQTITPAQFSALVTGTVFNGTQCQVYDGTGGNCVVYSTSCVVHGTSTPAQCPTTPEDSITVKTAYNNTIQPLSPGFLQGDPLRSPITTVVGNGTFATVTCAGECSTAVGQTVTLIGNSVAGFNATVTATAATVNTFTFNISVSGTGTGGYVTSHNVRNIFFSYTTPRLDGTISGRTKNFSEFIATAITQQLPVFTSSASDSATDGTASSFIVNSTGTPTPALTETGALPSGVSFADNGDGTGTLSVASTASATGTYTFVITAANSLGSTKQTFKLCLQAPQGQLSLSQPALDFGYVYLGTRRDLSVMVKNTGGSSFRITNIYFTPAAGPAKNDFGYTTQCGGTLNPGKSCTIVVELHAQDVGVGSSLLNIAYNLSGSPAKVSLSGNVINPKLKLKPASVNFGTVKVGKNSTSSVTVISNGDTPLLINGISIAGSSAFTETNNCPGALAANASCTIKVVFTPSAEKLVMGTLNITANAQPSMQTVSLSGNGS